MPEKNNHHAVNISIMVAFLLLGLDIAILYASSQGMFILAEEVKEVIRGTIVAIATMLVVSIIIRFTSGNIHKLLGKDIEPEYKVFISNSYTLVLYLFAALFVLFRIGISLANLTVFLGLLTTGIAFALRDLLVSYLAWIIILTRKPFGTGDILRIGEDEGRVRSIDSIMFTIETSAEQRRIRFPNKTILEKPVQVLGREELIRTAKLPIKMLPKEWEKKKVSIERKEDCTLDLSADNSLCIMARFKTSFNDRYKRETEILRTLIKEFPKETANILR